MICAKCNSKIDQNFAYCPYCGSKVKKSGQKQNRNVKKRGNGQGTVFKRGDKWLAQVTVGWKPDGKRITHTKTFGKKTDAIKSLSTLKSEYNPSQISPQITFEKCFDEMMRQHQKRIGRSAEEGYYYAFKHLSEISGMKISDIKTTHIQSCVDKLDSWSKQTKAKGVAMLTFKYAMQNDIVDRNYAEYVTIGRFDREERKPFTIDEVRKIVDSVGTVPFADYIAVLIFTGMRPNEMFALKKGDYYGTYFMGGSKTKAGKNRQIPVPAIIQPIVESSLNQNSDYIFPSPNGKQFDLRNFRSRFYYTALKQIGVRPLSPYCCRHTFATMLKNIDAPATDKQKVMGHASFVMTAHYTHTDTESVQTIANGLQTYFESAHKKSAEQAD